MKEKLTMTNEFPVTITELAAKEVLKNFEADNSQTKYLRVGVQGGGCSGLNYVMDIADAPEETDLQSEQFGVKILVDEMSAPYLVGTEVDYSTGLMGNGFKFINKNKRHCGCGSSFAV